MSADTQKIDVSTLLLSAEDIKAFRQATGVSVHLEGETANIRLCKKIPAKYGDPFRSTERELHHDVRVGTRSTQPGHFYSMFIDHSGWQAIALIVKIGDRILLTGRTNGNQYVEQAGLFKDELLVTIVRKDKQIIRDMPVEDSITPDNLARALRPLKRY